MSDHHIREHPAPELRPVVSQREAPSQWKTTSPLSAVHAVFKAMAQANEHLKARLVGPADQEAVIAALGARGDLDLAILDEAAGPRVFDAVRQEIARTHQREAKGHTAQWVSLPLILTGHTYEASGAGHDTSLVEALLGAPSHISRVLFPPDYNTTALLISEIYATTGQIWTAVVPRSDAVPDLFTVAEANRIIEDGAMVIAWSGYDASNARLVLTAIGAFQLSEVLRASRRLTRKKLPHTVVVMAEPGRFRVPREKGEREIETTRAIRDMLYPPTAAARVFVTHMRPESALGVLRPLDTGPRTTAALGYINAVGALDTPSLLFANRCSWAHIVEQSAALLGMAREELLDADVLDALDGKTSPRTAIFAAADSITG